MTSMIPNTTNQNQEHVENLGEVTEERGGENMNREIISEPSLENETASDNGDNLATNMGHNTSQEVFENAESKGKKKRL